MWWRKRKERNNDFINILYDEHEFTLLDKTQLSVPDVPNVVIVNNTKWNTIFNILLIMYYIIPLIMYYSSYIPALYTFYRVYNNTYGKGLMNYVLPVLYSIY